MAEAWEQENNFSQRDKESKRTHYAHQTSTSAAAIDNNTDELEGLIRTLNGKLDTIKAAVDSAKTAIVNAIQNKNLS